MDITYVRTFTLLLMLGERGGAGEEEEKEEANGSAPFGKLLGFLAPWLNFLSRLGAEEKKQQKNPIINYM